MAEIKLSVSNEEVGKKNSDLPCGYDEIVLHPVNDDLQCSICQIRSTLRGPVLSRFGY